MADDGGPDWFDATVQVKRESRLATVILVLVVVAFLPGLVLGVTVGPDAGVAAAFGSLGALMVMLMAGSRAVLLSAAPYGLAAGLVVFSAERPALAFIVMGVAAGLAAWTARFGLAGAFSLMPIMLAFLLAQPPSLASGSSAFWIGVLVAIGAAWMAVVGWLVSRRKRLPKLSPFTPARSMLYAVILGLVVGSASAVIVANQWGHGGAWFVMTLIIVVQPYMQDSWHKAVQRGLGTILGVVIAVVLADLIPWDWLAYVAAVVFIFFAVRMRLQPDRPYWMYVTLLTPSVLLLEGESTSVTDLAGTRLLATFGAVAIGLLLVVVLRPFLKPLAQRAGLAKF